LEAQYVLYAQELKNNLLSFSVLGHIGFVVTFQRRKVLIYSEGDILDTIVRIGVRDGSLYRL
jgi:hypothetical protein